jgi:hypothetical protein
MSPISQDVLQPALHLLLPLGSLVERAGFHFAIEAAAFD